jgi:hypothetical protein
MDLVSLKTVQRFGCVLATATLFTGCARKSTGAEGARNMADVGASAFLVVRQRSFGKPSTWN